LTNAKKKRLKLADNVKFYHWHPSEECTKVVWESLKRMLVLGCPKLERFSIECRKAESKVITLANHKEANNRMNQSELEEKNM